MNKKQLQFIICMILSVTLVLMMTVGVFAAPEDDLTDDTPIGTTDDVATDDTGDDTDGTDELPDTDGEPTETDPYADYVYICGEETGLSMYADLETGLFFLQEAVDGKTVRWHSTVDQEIDADDPTIGAANQSVRSQIVIESISREEMATKSFTEERTSKFDCIDQGLENIKVEKLDNGLKVTYTFSAVSITIPVKYTLENGKFYATILADEIKDDKDHVLITVNLLPAFGAADWNEDDGYMFVPDGCGALINFNNGAYRELGYRQYEAWVYGEDMAIVQSKQVTTTEDIRLPVFGIVKGNNALYGIITDGDGAASITAMSGNKKFGYNGASTIFHYSVMQKQLNLFNKRDINLVAEPNFNKGDVYRVCYSTLSGNDANYIGIATAYREYLKTEKSLKKKDTTPTLHVDAIGAFEQSATFLGIIPYTETVSLTTYEQCQTILGELQSGGAEKLTLRYSGWSNNGMENKKLPKKVDPISKLGGSKGLTALQDFVNGRGISFYPDVDLLTFRESGNGVSARSSGIRTVFGKVSYQQKYMLSTYVSELNSAVTVVLTPEKIQWAADRYLNSLIEENFTAVSLSNLGDCCYSNYYEDNEQYRYHFPANVVSVLEKYAGKTKLSFNGGNAYVLPYADLITEVPTHSSGYDLFNEDVPFYQAVLHGWISYTTESIPQSGNPEVTFLTGVETGSELLYVGIYEDASALFDTEFDHLYGSSYKLWMTQALGYYKSYMPLLEKVKDQVITQHGKLEDGVYLTGYADGTQVVVNYNDADVTVNGVTIPAGGFKWDTDKWSLEQPESTPDVTPDDGTAVVPGETTVTDDGEGDEL